MRTFPFLTTKAASWHNDLEVGVPFGIRNAAFPEVVAGDNDRASSFSSEHPRQETPLGR